MWDKGDLTGSIAELRTAIALDPKYPMAHNNLGVALRSRGDLETNRKLLERRQKSANDRKYAANELSASLQESDLSGVRPGTTREGWSQREVAAWDAHWSSVRAAYVKMKDNTGPPRP